MRTIKWQCTTNWQWVGADGTIIQNGPGQLEGTITLPPNESFWYQVANLNLGGPTRGTGGVAALRYYRDQGADRVQVFTDARGAWHDEGQASNVASSTGETGRSGGISLTAAFQ